MAASARIVVLFAGSSEPDHEQLRTALKGANCRVHSVYGCREAWMALHEDPVDVVITETAFGDGLCWRDLLDEMKAMESAPPLVLASNLADSRLWAEALELGVFDILTKPFEAKEAEHVVRLARDRASAVRRKPVTRMEGAVVVADSPQVRQYVKAVLERRGYTVFAPPDEEVDGVLATEEVALLITSRPERFARSHPELRILYIDVVPDRHALQRLPNKTTAILQKPFSAIQLAAMVERLLDVPAVATVALRYRQQAQLTLAPGAHVGFERLARRAQRAREIAAMLSTQIREAAIRRDALWRRIAAGAL